MSNHLLVLTAFGLAIMMIAWLPSISRKIKISYPIILLGIGFLIFYFKIPIQWPDPFWPDTYTLYISELIVVVSLMTAGLKIPTSQTKEFWKIPARLLLVAMPLTILGVLLLGTQYLDLSIGSAVLLAAVLAPTDPVLAAEVQLSDPENQDGEPPETEFSLTAEAGLNDGMAFPFTFLGVLLIEAGSYKAMDWTDWFLDKLLLKIALGIGLGWLFTKAILALHQWLCSTFSIKTKDGLLAFATAISVYAATELLHGYGFLAVFISSITFKHSQALRKEYKNKLHEFVDQMERLILVVWIVLFGGSIMNGILEISGWAGFFFALILIFLIRPLSALFSLLGHPIHFKEKLAISFFGIRGIGSLFYLSWAAVYLGDFADSKYLYALVAVVMLSSIVIHGLSAPFVFSKKKPK